MYKVIRRLLEISISEEFWWSGGSDDLIGVSLGGNRRNGLGDNTALLRSFALNRRRQIGLLLEGKVRLSKVFMKMRETTVWLKAG